MGLCGHGAKPRRVCDLCLTSGQDGPPFFACSLECLATHQAEAHAAAKALGATTRAGAYQAQVNRNFAHNREWYAAHRARVTELVVGAGSGGDLCVLGAGNGSDLELPALAERFATLHLVDIDGEALARCRAGAPAPLRERIVLHAGVDLSGFAEHLDAWGDAFPSAAELGRAAQPAIHAILGRLGQAFDVVVSTCALSQLAVPYHRAWLLPASDWANLHATVTAVHLATLVGATKPGGTALLIFDVLSSKTAPELRALEASPPQALTAFVEERARGGAPLDPDPTALLELLHSSRIDRLLTAPRLTGPWLWNIGAETQLVYGLLLPRS